MRPIQTMHLFAGIGGGLLADLILGHKPIVAVELDKYACRVLRERAADGWFPKLSVWEGDIRLFDPSEYAECVDCIHAGFPCQDISVAGKQAGLGEGTRSGLYREVLRIVRVVNEIRSKNGLPEVQIFLENVSAILSNGLGTVLGDLAEMGYDCKWLCIRASDVGAPHGRDRWFALAIRNFKSEHHEDLANTKRERLQRGKVAGNNGENRAEYGDELIAGCGERVERIEIKSSICGVVNGNPNKLDEIWWKVEPDINRVAPSVKNRVGRLKGLGNAQVPLQTAAAWRLLTRCLNEE